MQSFEAITVAISDRIATIEFIRPKALNAAMRELTGAAIDLGVVQPPVRFDGHPAHTRPQVPSFNANGDDILREFDLKLKGAVT